MEFKTISKGDDMKDLVDLITSKEGYRLICGNFTEANEEDKIIEFPYMKRIKRKTFSDEKAFNKIFNE